MTRLTRHEVERVAARLKTARALTAIASRPGTDASRFTRWERTLLRPLIRDLTAKLELQGRISEGDLLRATLALRSEVHALTAMLDLDDVLELLAAEKATTDERNTP